MTESSSTTGSTTSPVDDGSYDTFLAAVAARFATVCESLGPKPALFVAKVPDLFELYLDASPPSSRREHTCATCRVFFARFGGLVSVDAHGNTVPALWDPDKVPEPFAPAVGALSHAVRNAAIETVFLSNHPTWGRPTKGPFTHFALTPPNALVLSAGIKTARQQIAERTADRLTLLRALEEFPVGCIKKAVAILGNEALYRSEKCLGVAEWLLRVHEQLNAERSARRRDNLLWLVVATAPAGFCHVRSTMIGTLLEDLAAELPFETIKAKFAAKMHPLQYQRPTAAPSAQNIARAEAIVAQLESAGALERRFATLTDIVSLWQPPSPPAMPKPEGVFSHLAPAKTPSPIAIDAPPTVMTWEKFARTVLPNATQIEYLVPATKQSYMGLVTAKNPEAPPILQWDSEAQRNPVSPYVYFGGSAAVDWNLRAGFHHIVTAITLSPAMWHSTSSRSHHSQTVLFVLKGARDLKYIAGAGFFPEFLRNEYHEIRATMEAYAKRAVVAGRDQAEACGISLTKGNSWNQTFRVTTKDDLTLSYTLDRWD